MKLQSILSISLVAAATALSLGAHAANDADKRQADGTQSEQPAAKKMPPHSHMQEKTGIAPQEKSPDSKPAKRKADQDKSKHYHPRDGK
ncbi:MAG TPA: hypothetical protein DHV59_18150 [Oxalobacteraceae bacterium]|nr:hypothetical protein [Oxalobacteraceae bacterium]